MEQNLLQQLEAIVSRAVQQQAAASGAVGPASGAMTPGPISAGPVAFGLPQPGATMFGAMSMPQPTGVSVPVTVPLPDGRELSVRVHFGPDALGNLPGLAAACAAAFGQYLQARQPFGSRGNGFSSHFGLGRRRY